MSTVILTPLEDAISRLQEAATLYENTSSDDDKRDIYRDSLVMRFSVAQELSFVTLRRFLQNVEGAKLGVSKDVYREAGRLGLIESVESWFVYKEHRNLVVHTYNVDQANETAQIALRFLNDARSLLLKLQKAQTP